MQDWQKEILEKEGFNNIKFRVMNYEVYYEVTREARIFANMEDELMATFENFNDAVYYANSECGLDEMHSGYVVRPTQSKQINKNLMNIIK
tara:strand:- start:47 stop:319 length:273 start_codon:yes stop_codon:yes gene_type:complete